MGDRLGTPGAVGFFVTLFYLPSYFSFWSLRVTSRQARTVSFVSLFLLSLSLSLSIFSLFSLSFLFGESCLRLSSLNSGSFLVNGHTMLNTPVLVRSLKLSNIGPG